MNGVIQTRENDKQAQETMEERIYNNRSTVQWIEFTKHQILQNDAN